MKCQSCNREFAYDYDVPDEQWQAVCGRAPAGIYCLPCLHLRAQAMGFMPQVTMTTPLAAHFEAAGGRFECAFLRLGGKDQNQDGLKVQYRNLAVEIDQVWESKFTDDEWSDFHNEVGHISEEICRQLGIPSSIRVDVDIFKDNTGRNAAAGQGVYPSSWYGGHGGYNVTVHVKGRGRSAQGLLPMLAHEFEHLRQRLSGDLSEFGRTGKKERWIVDNAVVTKSAMDEFNYGYYDLYAPEVIWRGEIYYIRYPLLTKDQVATADWWSWSWRKGRRVLYNFILHDGFHLLRDGKPVRHLKYEEAPWEAMSGEAERRLPRLVRQAPQLQDIFASIAPKLRLIGLRMWDGK